MKTNLPFIPATAAIALALVLSACGKQEAVGDVPSSEQLAKEADAATAAIREEEAGAEDPGKPGKAALEEISLTSYNNALRGYSIMVPESWTADEAVGDDNGQSFNAPENGGTLTVRWSENRDNEDFTNAVEALEKAGDAMSKEQASENQYRASGENEDGRKSIVRIIRKVDGSMVNANINYPADSTTQLDTVAKQIIDSLALK